MAQIHRVGEPENASEAKAVRRLAEVLPDSYRIFHNFEVQSGGGLPYEYDVVVATDFCVWHLEVKGYHGAITGDAHRWVFENGGVQPSPIPLANKKSKVLAGKLKRHARALGEVYVGTCVLLTDDRARVRLRDEQAWRVVRLDDAGDFLTDPDRLPVRTGDISRLHDTIAEAILGSRPSRKVSRIGLYDVIEKINQTDTRSVFLASHRYIRTRPKTILKVFHFDVYESEDEKRRRIEAIFHDQNAMRLLGAHPNLIDTGDMFAWEDDRFVLPTEYLEHGEPLEWLLARDGGRSLTWGERADVIAKMARGLRHAHSRGVVHRDIRPLNVVVAPGGVVKLVNFDLARIEGAPHVGEPKGLAARLDRRYAAPEVWLDPSRADRRSDIYSLGIVFHELLTGTTPYDDVEAVIASGGETPLDPAAVLAALSEPGGEAFMRSPADALAVLLRMCRRDPAARYPTMDAVLEDLAVLRDD